MTIVEIDGAEDAAELHPAILLDLVGRLEDIAVLLWFESPISPDIEHQLVLELGRLRALEAASAIATLAEQLARRPASAAA
ncbi:MAG TPA: hypothetical protein VF913_16595 [Xanthobacteraceae bacterium]